MNTAFIICTPATMLFDVTSEDDELAYRHRAVRGTQFASSLRIKGMDKKEVLRCSGGLGPGRVKQGGPCGNKSSPFMGNAR